MSNVISSQRLYNLLKDILGLSDNCISFELTCNSEEGIRVIEERIIKPLDPEVNLQVETVKRHIHFEEEVISREDR